jgi:uncharacterized glyoxalase superfamily protein PhnB
MIANTVSAAFTTDKVEESRDFYVKYFDAKVTFDCGWYVNLQFGNTCSTLRCMFPQQLEQRLSNSAGLIYNFGVENVGEEYEKLTAAGLAPIMPPEDHAWGDRGFALQDPNGMTLYIYPEREPS